MKKNKMKAPVIIILISVLLYLSIQILVNELAINSIKSKDYTTLSIVSSIPLIKPNGLRISDFLDAIFERDQNYYPIDLACEKDDYHAVELMLSHGVNPNQKHWFINNDHLPLDTAVSQCNSEIVELLIKYGARSDQLQVSFRGAFSHQKRLGLDFNDSIKIIYDALDKKYHFSSEDNLGFLRSSARRCNIDAVDFFLNKLDGDYSWTDSEGNTILHFCMTFRQKKDESTASFINEVISRGCDLSKVNNDNKTAYDLAIEIGNDEIAELIKP